MHAPVMHADVMPCVLLHVRCVSLHVYHLPCMCMPSCSCLRASASVFAMHVHVGIIALSHTWACLQHARASCAHGPHLAPRSPPPDGTPDRGASPDASACSHSWSPPSGYHCSSPAGDRSDKSEWRRDVRGGKGPGLAIRHCIQPHILSAVRLGVR
eukprot:361947-Chlamydomonas_euryale.AAC.5